MKKLLSLGLLILLCFLLTGCGTTIDDTINFKDNFEKHTMSGITYKFTGKSEHFGFETGKVYYTEIGRQILIANFKQIKGISEIDQMNISISFNDKAWGSNSWSKSDNRSLNDYISNTTFAETGAVCENENTCESDSFIETTEEIFKDSIKIEIEYCYKEDCETEELKLSYIDDNNPSQEVEKEVLRITTIEPDRNECADKTKVSEYYKLLDGRKIYTYCLLEIFINTDSMSESITLKKALDQKEITIDEIISKLTVEAQLWDGGTTIYKDTEKKVAGGNLTIIKCNTLEGNKDIYIGNENMEYQCR